MQAPIIQSSLDIEAPHAVMQEAHNTRSVQSITTTQKRGFLGFGKSSKTTSEHMHQWVSQGTHISGPSFVVRTQEFRAEGGYFNADHADITADRAQLRAGTSGHTLQTYTLKKDMIWNKMRSTQERQKTYTPCTFGKTTFIHASNVSMEITQKTPKPGGLITDHPVHYISKKDEHYFEEHKKKSLTAEAALVVKLAITAALCWNPVTFGLTGVMGTVASAGFGALCGEASIALIENDGDPLKALRSMNTQTAITVAKSMASAGLMSGVSDVCNIHTGLEMSAGGQIIERSFQDYAAKSLLQSAIDTSFALAEGQYLGKALTQGSPGPPSMPLSPGVLEELDHLTQSKKSTS